MSPVSLHDADTKKDFQIEARVQFVALIGGTFTLLPIRELPSASMIGRLADK